MSVFLIRKSKNNKILKAFIEGKFIEIFDENNNSLLKGKCKTKSDMIKLKFLFMHWDSLDRIK